MRVLVTGSSGAIGAAVCARLSGRGHEVTGLSLRPPADDKLSPGGFEAIVGDAGDRALVNASMRAADAVVHLAAIPAPSLGEPEVVFTNNVRATYTVLEAAGRHGVGRAVVASSLSAIGAAWASQPRSPRYVPVDSDHPLEPEDAYSLSKQVDELTCAMMDRRFGMTVVALRFPFVGAGERLHERFQALEADPASGAGDLWGYLRLDDAAVVVEAALTADVSGCQVVMVSAPDTAASLDTELLLDRFHPTTERRAPLPGRCSLIDVSQAARVLGFTARRADRHGVAAPEPPTSTGVLT